MKIRLFVLLISTLFVSTNVFAMENKLFAAKQNKKQLPMGYKLEYNNWNLLKKSADTYASANELSMRAKVSEKKLFDKWVCYSEFLFKTKTKNTCFHTINKNNKVIAFALCLDKTDNSIYLSELAVHKDEQRRGLGKKLIYSVFDRYPEIKKIELSCVKGNKKALNFYIKLGFVVKFEGFRGYNLELKKNKLVGWNGSLLL